MAACSAPRPVGQFSKELLDVAPSDMGLIVGSFGPRRDERRYLAVALAIRHIASQELAIIRFYAPHARVHTSAELPPPDFQDEKYFGANIAMKVPAGQYAIVNFAVLDLQGYDQRTWKFGPDFAVPFRVDPGRATYIGQYIFEGLSNPFLGEKGWRQCMSLAMRDAKVGDIAFAQAKWPEFDFAAPNSGMPDLTRPNPLSASLCKDGPKSARPS
jgi:hypothetical protein